MKIYHNSHDLKYRNPFGAALCTSKVSLSISAPYSASVTLRLWYELSGESLIQMTRAKSESEDEQSENSLFTAEIEMPDTGCLVWYFFIIRCGGETLFYGNSPDGFGGEGAMSSEEPRGYQITVYEKSPIPTWYKDSIVYQIFPDRFRRGPGWDTLAANNLEMSPSITPGTDDLKADYKCGTVKFLEKDWSKKPYYIKNEKGAVTHWPFYGGTLSGIKEKLPYLSSLGVTAIYLNPIFKAASNHRYDTADYLQIDPVLGNEKDFKELTAAAKNAGIRLILDGVFSHTGSDSIYFDKYGNYRNSINSHFLSNSSAADADNENTGAYGNPHSRFRSWYNFNSVQECGYDCWWGVEDLPEVNETEPTYIDFICGKNGVLEKWLKAGASGWRLDVADELPDSFIENVRSKIKSVSPDALLLGEVWEDASNKYSHGENRKYLMGHELDAVMNYPFRQALLDFFTGVSDAYKFTRQMMSLCENYPPENFYGNLNLIGSHDRARVLTLLSGADSAADNNCTDFSKALHSLRMMTVIQYVMPGVPCIYYGDEIGLLGGTDPENRGTFPWDDDVIDTKKGFPFNNTLSEHYRQLGLIYHDHQVLKDGSFKALAINERTLLLIRENTSEKMLTIVNTDPCCNTDISIDTDGYKYALDLLHSVEHDILNGHLEFSLRPSSIVMILLRPSCPPEFEMNRSAGVICHLSSLTHDGKEALGKPARDFVDWLVSAGMKLWQILPLNPAGPGNSPYSSTNLFAGDHNLINRKEIPDDIDRNKFPDDAAFKQQVFKLQWSELRKYANRRGIGIIGDLPIYAFSDSVDVKTHPEYFAVNKDGSLNSNAGSPPDNFSPEGQNWKSNPLYNWEKLKADGYRWWFDRIRQARERYDYTRIDHFKAFSSYFAIPRIVEKRTAAYDYGSSSNDRPTRAGLPADGSWLPGPGLDFFDKLYRELGDTKLIAEDLGQLDNGVYNLLKLSGLPGMNVWQFSADEMIKMTDEEARRRIFYSGTHDNSTLASWLKIQKDKASISANNDTGSTFDITETDDIIKALYNTRAPWVIIQMQDALDLDDSARMNIPGTTDGNWEWRLDHTLLTSETAEKFRKLAIKTDRYTIDDFLKNHMMHPDCIDFDEYRNIFLTEMKKRISEGKISPSYIYPRCSDANIDPINPTGITAEACSNKNGKADIFDRSAIVIDAGGTNLRCAKAHTDRYGKIVIPNIHIRPIPGSEDAVTSDEFFETIADIIIETADAASYPSSANAISHIGFCFSFPAEITEKLDAKILKWAKELKISGGTGNYVAASLRNALKQINAPVIKVLNDATATLLGSYNKAQIAFVLGTGSNMAFVDEDGQIINLESGTYDCFPQSNFDIQLDRASSNPGESLAEKMISGAYLDELVRITEDAARKAGFRDTVSADLTLHDAIRATIAARAGKIAAAEISAVIEYLHTDSKEITIIAEGSTFYKAQGLHASIEKFLPKVKFINIDSATLIGAARVVLN